MTDKQKLKSLELKMQRIEKNNPEIDFKFVAKRFMDIERYYKLRQEHFHLKFEMDYCEKCGKKI
jgi:hypothetical protein